jgi:Fur family ferric uptake transcriptional regulator
VLERLDAATSPLSHAELAEELSSFGYDRVTVYRNLSDLVGVGLVTRRDVGDHVWRFELVRARGRPHGGEHPHFLCIDCGDVSCLPDNAVKITASRNVPRSVSRRAVEVQVKGRCDACAR